MVLPVSTKVGLDNNCPMLNATTLSLTSGEKIDTTNELSYAKQVNKQTGVYEEQDLTNFRKSGVTTGTENKTLVAGGK